MKKIATIAIIAAIFTAESSSVCVYQDCGQYVLSHKLIFQQKLNTALKTTDSSLGSVETALDQHIAAVDEQNLVLDKLETLSAQNNLTIREIEAEQARLSALIAEGNKLEAKKAEALQNQSEKITTSIKIKAEDP